VLPIILAPDAAEEMVAYCDPSGGGLRQVAPSIRGGSGASPSHHITAMRGYQGAAQSHSGASSSEPRNAITLGHPAALVMYYRQLSLTAGHGDSQGWVHGGDPAMEWLGHAASIAIERQEQARLMEGIKAQSLSAASVAPPASPLAYPGDASPASAGKTGRHSSRLVRAQRQGSPLSRGRSVSSRRGNASPEPA